MCLYCTKSNEINRNLPDIQRYICNQNGNNSFNFYRTGYHKKLWIRYVQCLEEIERVLLVESWDFKMILTICIAINVMELTHFFEMYNSIFHVQDHSTYIWYIMGYALKRRQMYFEMCSIVFNAFQKNVNAFGLFIWLSVRLYTL